MITISAVKPEELTAVLAQIKASGKALVNEMNPISGTITAAYWPLHIRASYSLSADGMLTINANELEGTIQKQLIADLNTLRAQGI